MADWSPVKEIFFHVRFDKDETHGDAIFRLMRLPTSAGRRRAITLGSFDCLV